MKKLSKFQVYQVFQVCSKHPVGAQKKVHQLRTYFKLGPLSEVFRIAIHFKQDLNFHRA